MKSKSVILALVLTLWAVPNTSADQFEGSFAYTGGMSTMATNDVGFGVGACSSNTLGSSAGVVCTGVSVEGRSTIVVAPNDAMFGSATSIAVCVDGDGDTACTPGDPDDAIAMGCGSVVMTTQVSGPVYVFLMQSVTLDDTTVCFSSQGTVTVSIDADACERTDPPPVTTH